MITVLYNSYGYIEKRRVVFVNLHGNEFLVKTLNKIVFGQSVAVKHRYLLDYLLGCDDIEVCTYINERGYRYHILHVIRYCKVSVLSSIK